MNCLSTTSIWQQCCKRSASEGGFRYRTSTSQCTFYQSFLGVQDLTLERTLPSLWLALENDDGQWLSLGFLQ